MKINVMWYKIQDVPVGIHHKIVTNVFQIMFCIKMVSIILVFLPIVLILKIAIRVIYKK